MAEGPLYVWVGMSGRDYLGVFSEAYQASEGCVPDTGARTLMYFVGAGLWDLSG